MSAEDENRLSRWSRLKRKRAKGEAVDEPPAGEARAEPDEPVAVRPGRGAARPTAGKPYLPPLADPDTPVPENALVTEGDDGESENDARELTEDEAAYVATLPPVEELNGDSDFTGFLDKRVPEFIRRRALRKLWLSDPAFSFLDGMNEYDEDYSMMVELAAGATSYRPDQGGYGWKDRPASKPAEGEETEAGDNATTAPADADAEVAESITGHPESADGAGESLADKASRVQDRGGSSVRAPAFTANPYYQTPGLRYPAPEVLPEPKRSDPARLTRPQAADAGAEDMDDDLGDAEDDFT